MYGLRKFNDIDGFIYPMSIKNKDFDNRYNKYYIRTKMNDISNSYNIPSEYNDNANLTLKDAEKMSKDKYESKWNTISSYILALN